MTRYEYAMAIARADNSEGCVIWPFGNYSGYVTLHLPDGRRERAHAVICAAAHGPRPSEKYDAAHSCGRRRCVNPRHLRWATRRENLSDRAAHGTLRKGDSHYNTKIPDATISEIHARFYAVAEAWATEYGTTAETIRRILSGKSRTTGE